MRNNSKSIWAGVLLSLIVLGQSNNVVAAPIVVEGAVPNEASKQAILLKMQSIYGADRGGPTCLNN